MTFLYFVPKIQSATDEELRSRRLDKVIDRPEVGVVLANGPGGTAGLVITDRSHDISPRIVLTHQTWRPAPLRGAESPPYYVGYWNEKRPTEESLRRRKGLPGEAIELRDGAKWTVPRLVQFADKSPDVPIQYEVTLPKVLDVNDDGDLIAGAVDPKYAELWDRGWAAHHALMGQATETGQATMTEMEARRLAVDLMAVNYRLTALEIAMLGLFESETPIRVVCSAIDNATFWTAIKNRVGRLDYGTTDSPSGAERPATESITSTPTGQP